MTKIVIFHSWGGIVWAVSEKWVSADQAKMVQFSKILTFSIENPN